MRRTSTEFCNWKFLPTVGAVAFKTLTEAARLLKKSRESCRAYCSFVHTDRFPQPSLHQNSGSTFSSKAALRPSRAPAQPGAAAPLRARSAGCVRLGEQMEEERDFECADYGMC